MKGFANEVLYLVVPFSFRNKRSKDTDTPPHEFHMKLKTHYTFS
jgi:hypothetical protein